MKLDQKQLESVCRLLNDADFNVLLNAMGNHAEELNKRLVMQKMDTGDLHNLQGQTRNMVTLMEALTEAPKKLQEHAQPKT